MNVTQIPLGSLGTETGVDLHHVRDVVSGDVKALLSSGIVRFVIADIGKPLRWISEAERFQFWKEEVATHLADEEIRSLDETHPTPLLAAVDADQRAGNGGVKDTN